MENKKIMGYCDCPVCKIKNGVRFTPDKNGKPFGYCYQGCRLQLRIGGDPYREQEFAKNFPGVQEKPEPLPALPEPVTTVTVPVTEAKPAPAPTKKPVTVTDPAPAPAPKKTGRYF